MNKKILINLSLLLIGGTISTATAMVTNQSSCFSPVACPACNPCKPNCALSGCFTIDSTGTVVSQTGNGFVVTPIITTPIVPLMPATFLVTVVNPFCSPLVAIAQQSGVGIIPVTTPATGNSFTLTVTVPEATPPFSGAPTSTICFIAVPAV